MKQKTTMILIMLLVVTGAFAQETPKPAVEIMTEAILKATKENKSVFLMFHASWCGWCKKMDAAMNDETCKDYFDKNFVTIHMVVKESKDNKHLETPGANDLLIRYKGEDSGIPFWLIFNREGRLLADSYIREKGVGLNQAGDNIGCPASDDEVDEFIAKLKIAAPMSKKEEAAIKERFKKNRN